MKNMVPVPVKWVFDRFPIVQHESAKEVRALTSSMINRTFPFSGGVESDRIQLGVYGVFYEECNGHKVVLASDPLCLYVQLWSCRKYNLTMPVVEAGDGEGRQRQASRAKDEGTQPRLSDNDPNALVILSEKAHRDERLPILIEKSSSAPQRGQRRSIRSMDSIMAHLELSLDDKEKAIAKLLDTTVYDCFLLSVVHDGMVSEVYGNSPDILQTLAKRNQFYTRHDTSPSLFSDPVTAASERELTHLIETTTEILLLIQELYGEFSSFLKYKVTSYVLTLARLAPFEQFPARGLYRECISTLAELS